MIVDYRIYCTIYALLSLAWCASIPLMHRYGHRFANRWMRGTLGAALTIGFVNYSDWLWS